MSIPSITNNKETLDDVLSVIVLYKCDLRNSISFNSLLKAVENSEGVLELLLYNNSPEINIDTSAFEQEKINVSLINDNTNSGVSKAYNLAHSITNEEGKKWLLLLDQDTQLPSDFFSVFFEQRKKDAEERERLYIPVIKSNNRIISPAQSFLYRGFMKKKVQTGSMDIKNLAIINSGAIVKNDLFESAGGFNKEVQLDFSDVSFFRRVKKIYSKVFVLNVECSHSFSGLEYDNYEKVLNRFKIYNRNAVAFSKEKGVRKTFVFITVLIRAINLSMKFRTLNFLRSFRLK
jgi:GT2 family glycosyltransferase